MQKTKGDQQKNKTGKKPIRNALKMATVVASLGASLGVNVDTLLAADLSATDPCGDLTQISMSQGELVTQVKKLIDQQNTLISQLRQYTQYGTIVPLSNVTVMKNTSYDLVNQFKLSNLTDTNLMGRFTTDQNNITSRIVNVQSRQNELMNLFKMFQENQTTMLNLLNNLKVDQTK